MNAIAIRTSDDGYQIQTITIAPNGKVRSLRLEIRRLVRLDKWFLSVYDATTGENIIQYIPLVSSIPGGINDILAQFGYKEIGSAIVGPKHNEQFGTDPAEGTLGDFEIVWGDRLGQ